MEETISTAENHGLEQRTKQSDETAIHLIHEAAKKADNHHNTLTFKRGRFSDRFGAYYHRSSSSSDVIEAWQEVDRLYKELSPLFHKHELDIDLSGLCAQWIDSHFKLGNKAHIEGNSIMTSRFPRVWNYDDFPNLEGNNILTRSDKDEITKAIECFDEAWENYEKAIEIFDNGTSGGIHLEERVRAAISKSAEIIDGQHPTPFRIITYPYDKGSIEYVISPSNEIRNDSFTVFYKELESANFDTREIGYDQVELLFDKCNLSTTLSSLYYEWINAYSTLGAGTHIEGDNILKEPNNDKDKITKAIECFDEARENYKKAIEIYNKGTSEGVRYTDLTHSDMSNSSRCLELVEYAYSALVRVLNDPDDQRSIEDVVLIPDAFRDYYSENFSDAIEKCAEIESRYENIELALDKPEMETFLPELYSAWIDLYFRLGNKAHLEGNSTLVDEYLLSVVSMNETNLEGNNSLKRSNNDKDKTTTAIECFKEARENYKKALEIYDRSFALATGWHIITTLEDSQVKEGFREDLIQRIQGIENAYPRLAEQT